jgi:hypothetical protein
MHTNRLISAAVLLAGFAVIAKPQGLLAPTPPMGWNSWDSFGTTITEAEVKANADYMTAHNRTSEEPRLAVHHGGYPVVRAESQDTWLPATGPTPILRWMSSGV